MECRIEAGASGFNAAMPNSYSHNRVASHCTDARERERAECGIEIWQEEPRDEAPQHYNAGIKEINADGSWKLSQVQWASHLRGR